MYRVSFYELMVDDGEWQKQKSSGVMICPGTGSTSWHLNVNHISFQAVQEILQVGKSDSCSCSITACLSVSWITQINQWIYCEYYY